MRAVDYFYASLWGMWLFVPGHNFLAYPIFIYTMLYPRYAFFTRHWTFRAELLPHTEQVVFYRAWFFGSVRKEIVDIKDLKKVEPEVLSK